MYICCGGEGFSELWLTFIAVQPSACFMTTWQLKQRLQ